MRRTFATASLGCAISVVIGACGGAARGSLSAKRGATQPRLGMAYAHTEGFGQAHPVAISLGGDGTGVVLHIHWTHWGSPEATGTGEAVWVWPGTCDGCNGLSHARVVAFHLGACDGLPSYNALEWYFPEYGDTFSKTRFLDLCTGVSEGAPQWIGAPSSLPPQCPAARLADDGVATEMSAEGISCKRASSFVDHLPRGPYKSARRFIVGSFRCGTQGAFSGPAVVQCERGYESITFTAVY
jgi:hypothetical protein